MLKGPDTYKLTLTATTYRLSDDRPQFCNAAARRGIPKLYIVSHQRKPIYVGITVQPMSSRLRYGWQANGRNGYYGYQWRQQFENVELDIWHSPNDSSEKPLLQVETIEAEVVFGLRQKGQWPLFQTEIHFHQSSQEHRKIAKKVLSHYTL